MALRWRLRFTFALALALASLLALKIDSDRRWRNGVRRNHQDQLLDAAFFGDIAAIRAHLEAGADINGAPVEDGKLAPESPLSMAVGTNRENVVRYLLDHGANPNGTRGETSPLMRIAWDRSVPHLPIARLLLEHGANPNVPVEGLTPLAAARKSNQPDLILLLQQYHARE